MNDNPIFDEHCSISTFMVIQTRNTTHNANILHWADLCQYTEADLKLWRNMGQKTLREIKDTMQQLGLKLKE